MCTCTVAGNTYTVSEKVSVLRSGIRIPLKNGAPVFLVDDLYIFRDGASWIACRTLEYSVGDTPHFKMSYNGTLPMSTSEWETVNGMTGGPLVFYFSAGALNIPIKLNVVTAFSCVNTNASLYEISEGFR